ncbi:MAG: MarR family transcriptional regulator [Desulfobacteraceae bacterium]|nr:MAG: MarR family transcriptional regulator [Desulfobacteraceae bacterium]
MKATPPSKPAVTKEVLTIHGKFQSLMELAIKLDKSPKAFGTSELMSHSEIHLIEIIGDMEGSSVTDISRHLGVTKGAVSQGLKRLEQKGMTQKQPDPENLSRACVTLTAKGRTAYWAHKHWHETMDGGFSRYLQDIEKEKLDIIIEFLGKVEDFLKLRIHSNE